MMKRVIKISYRPLIGVVLAALFLLWGCTKEELSDCPHEAVLSVVGVDVESGEIDDEHVIEGILMYVFDNKQCFIRTIKTSVGQIEPIYFPNQDTLHIVSWGNLTDERQQLPDLKEGTPMHEAMVMLKTKPVKSQTRSIAESPDDLFYSYDKISLKSGTQTEYKLYLSRASAGMSITMRHLQGFTNLYDENYALVVRETYSAIDFYGRLTGDKVGYIPTISFNDKKELTAPLFNLLPSDAEGLLEIDVYHDGELVTTVKRDTDGQPIRALRGKVLNLLVDFHLTIEVSVEITSWGTEYIWKDYSISNE